MFGQPIGDLLESSRRVLLAGCGGGYDILGAVPIAHELQAAGKHVELASLSFTRLDRLSGHEPVAEVPHLFRASAAAATTAAYCPEACLSAWLTSRVNGEVPIWCFENVGVRPLRRAYEFLVRTLDVDAIVLIDGGVDSLLRGDETSLGTPAEDFASLAAVSTLDVPTKALACVGFGAELRDGIRHAQVLERIAELTAAGGLLGVWPLLAGTAPADAYEEATAFVAKRQRDQHGSHIHSVIGQSLKGKFGAPGPDVWISPLASIYWFFSLPAVTGTHLLLQHIQETNTLWEIAAIIEAVRKTMAVKVPSSIPL